MLADRVDDVAALLQDAGHDAWFLQDFHGSNPIAVRMLGLRPEQLATRRCGVCIHASGEVRVLAHRIEQDILGHWPGERFYYASYDEYAAGVASLIDGAHSIACEYSPRNRNPYLSYLDAGTVDLLRSGSSDSEPRPELIESGWLAQNFEAVLSDRQIDQYERSVAITSAAFGHATAFVRDRLRSGEPATEREVQSVILNHFDAHNLDPDHPPIVAVGPNSGQPHYETGTGSQTAIGPDSVLLIDLWGKLREPGAVFSDFTRMFYTGSSVPPVVAARFALAAAARDAAIDRLKSSVGTGRLVPGAELDRVARDLITGAGQGDLFTHRLGHSITTDLHGSGAHLDSFEIIEDRKLIPGLLFSVEPGLYDDQFGIRTEVNVRIDSDGQPHVYAGGPLQTEIDRLT